MTFTAPEAPIRVAPVGGLGEMGHHHLALDVGDDSFLIDCGILMPPPTEAGIDRITPSFEPAVARWEAGRLRGLLLTHGHIDHIGAVPDLLARLPAIPVYATPWTMALLRRRLARAESALRSPPDLRVVPQGETQTIGGCEVRWHRVTHSLPEASSLSIRSDVGCVVHSGDFRVQPTPLLGLPSDDSGLRAEGARGVDLALVDSTSSGEPGATEAETVIASRLADAVASVPGMAVVTIFSSHVERLWACALAAAKTGRRLCIYGRSLAETAQLAIERGVLPLESGELLPLEALEGVPRERVLLVVTGTQGEWRAPLARMARRQDRLVCLGPGDAVFWSARGIPGQERAIGALVNQFVDAGVRVVPPWDRSLGLHTSGHGRWEEVATWLSWVNPRRVVPVHGEPWHLHRHTTALESAFPADRVLRLRNGEELLLDPAADVARVVRGAAHEPTWHDEGRTPLAASDSVLRDRRRAARAGSVAVQVRGTGSTAQVSVITSGVVPLRLREELETEVAAALASWIAEPHRPAPRDAEIERVRVAALGEVRRRTGLKPVCTVRLLS